MEEAAPFAIVLVTAPPGAPAEALARALVEEGLAACVNRLGPVRSTYRWRDAIHDDAEDLLIVKTSRDRLPELERRVREIHPYEVPEVLALPIDLGSAAYLAWLAGSLRKE